MKPLTTERQGPHLMFDANDYDALDFDARDEIDAQHAEDLRSILFDLPARPGTLR